MATFNYIIFFRCDGGKTDGMGHVMQSITLAENFKRMNCDIQFVTFSPDSVGKQKIEDYGFKVHLSPGKAGSESDLEFMLNMLNQKIMIKNKTILIIDNRYVEKNYFSKCLPMCTLVRMTDQIDQDYPCHVLINNSIGLNKDNYKTHYDNQLLLLGSKYNLIHEKFFQNKKHDSGSQKNESQLHLLITMGGEDPFNHTSWFIRYFNDLFQNIQLTIIVGAAHPEKEQVKKDIKIYAPHATLVIDTDNMPYYMALADTAITAGGNTCYELAAMGVPQIGVVLELHQKTLIYSMENAGCLISLGWHDSLVPEKVRKTLELLIHSNSKRLAMKKKANTLFAEPGAPHIVSDILNHLQIIPAKS